MKQARTADKIYRMALKLNRPIPKELANAPRVYPWLLLFQRAFKDLIADRPSLDSPIPWTARQHWAEVHHLNEELTSLLHIHVTAQDVAFLEYLSNKRRSQEGDSRGKSLVVRPEHASNGKSR